MSRLRLRVLVVEDELLIAMELERMLVSLGCLVIGPVPSVDRALAVIEGEEPDFAILDVNLGRERSTPVAHALQARGVPFALSTGYYTTQLPEAAFRDAPQLGKPLDRRLLLEALKFVRHRSTGSG